MARALADEANQRLVDRLIAEGALWSPALIAAFRATPRHRFLDRLFQFRQEENAWHEVLLRDPRTEELRQIYADRALITHVSTPGRDSPGVPISSSSQPSLMAQMLEDLAVSAGKKTLEVGAGTGYNAALLAHVAGPGQVISIDVDRNVLSEAWDHLRAFAERDVTLAHADGREGYAEAAPYDRIMVTAATPDLEPAWLEQLSPDGILLAPLAQAPGLAFVACGRVVQGVFEGQLTRPAYFMPLRDEGTTGPGDADGPRAPLAAETAPSPWSGWFDRRRPRASWLGFIQALAFYGWLSGLTVHCQSLGTGEPSYGVSQDQTVCWFGIQQWQVSGSEGKALGRRLWRAFLEAGGPRPTEYALWAQPADQPFRGPDTGFRRVGARCRQAWRIKAERERPAWC